MLCYSYRCFSVLCLKLAIYIILICGKRLFRSIYLYELKLDGFICHLCKLHLG